MLRSGNGSNFAGAQKELEKTYSEMDNQKIQFFLQNLGADYINWHKNPPASSHMGGCLGKINSVGTYNTDVFIAPTRKISKR